MRGSRAARGDLRPLGRTLLFPGAPVYLTALVRCRDTAWCEAVKHAGAARSYKKLAEDVQPGSQILCADGSIVLEVLSTNAKAGTVHCKCLNNATLGCGRPARPRARHARAARGRRASPC